METKKNDLVLNMLANPGFSLNNFQTVGLTSDNTALRSEDDYANSKKIQNNALFKDETGNFSRNKFHEFYQTANSAYEFMAGKDYNDSFGKKARSYHRDDIFAPADLKRKGPDFSWVKQSNPDRNNSSIIRLGKTTESDKTWDELAQMEKVLANPLEATRSDGTVDETKAIWHDSPNDSWFTDFWDTRVAAQWDEDGDHIDPVTGEKTHHSKGDLKLNADGNYYYENLEGRDVYGRRVLNKMNTLTTDGSEWNKYDFFDSDGKDKSIGGSIMKNVALAGSMFIPYVGPWVAGLSVASQTAGLLGTLGKMYVNSDLGKMTVGNVDDSIFSNMEGFAKSVNRQEAKSEYAQNNAWCWENLIGMVGDVMAQFKEQRFLFKYAPYALKNKFGIVDDSNYKSKLDELEKIYALMDRTKMEDLIRAGKGSPEMFRGLKELEYAHSLKATGELDSYIKGYNKIGEILAKGYMTGVTVGDTYGEAKNQGATDNEAVWLTLGYGAGEAAILNTGVGEWLFPELRYEKLHQNAIAKAAVKAQGLTKEAEQKMASAASEESQQEIKQNLVKKIFNIGKQTAKDLYDGYKSDGSKTVKAAFFNAMGEGTEEVTEEFLADFSKACFNGVEWLRGKKTRLDAFDNGDWGNILSRYSMNFLGGFIGGGAAGFSLDNIRSMKNLDNMEFDQAIQEMISMVRNGTADDFLKLVDKMELGNKNLSATKFTKNEDGSYSWAEGTVDDNLDLAAKNAIKAQVKLFKDILSAEGIKMSDDSFFASQTDLLPDLKFALLQKSATAGRFLQEFNSLGARIAQANLNLLAEKNKENGENSKNPADNNGGGDATADIAENQKMQLTQLINNIQQQLASASDEEAVNLKTQLKELQKQLGNTQDKGSKVANIERELKELRKQKEDLVTGKRAPEFIRDALYEMTSEINNDFIKPSFIRYAEYKTGKNFNAIDDNTKARLQDEWNNWGEMDRAEQVHTASEIFFNVLSKSQPLLQGASEQYETLLKSPDVKNLQEILANYLNIYQDISNSKLNSAKWIERAKGTLESMYNGLGLAFSDETFANAYRELGLKEKEILDKLASDLTDILRQTKAINEDTTLSAEEKAIRTEEFNSQSEQLRNEAQDAIFDLNQLQTEMMHHQVIKSVASLIDPYIKQGFANSEVKRALSQILDITADRINSLLDGTSDEFGNPDPNSYKEKHKRLKDLVEGSKSATDAQKHEYEVLDKFVKDRIAERKQLRELKKQLNELSATPIEKILDQFTLGTGVKVNFTQLFKEVNDALQSNDIEKFSISDDTYNQLGEALQVMNLLRSVLLASKIDGGSLDNLYGYTKTLNDMYHKAGTQGYIDLATMSADTANILLQDLTILRNRTNFIKNLYALNRGQKLSEQKRVSVNKDYLFFKRMKALVDGWGDDDDTWKGKKDLADKINHMETLMAYHNSKNLSPSPEIQAKIDEETMALEDAIYDFFAQNVESLKDPQKLGDLFRENFYLYDVPHDLLNSETTAINDNNFIWWLATRAAVKSRDFHKTYASIDWTGIAPIPNLEIATYENLAAIVNKDMFVNFYKGYRQAIKDDWNSKSVDARKSIITEQNKYVEIDLEYADEENAKDDYKDYPFMNVIAPKYANIVFTEGIPGAGKSTGVYKSTIRMIQAIPSLRDAGILDRVTFVYAAGSDSEEDLKAARKNAERSIEALGLDPSKTIACSLNDFMDSITVERKKCTLGPDGTWIVPTERYRMTRENEIRSASKLVETDTPPSLVIIDEMTNVSLFDLDDMDRHASKYGYTILGAGDTDLSGVSGEYEIKGNELFGAGTLGLYNANFINTPKLGVSMRTNNSQKTMNLPTIQSWINDPKHDLEIYLHYFEDESGLYGDLVIDNTDSDDDEDFIPNLKTHIDLMVSSLKDGEKIGYVYTDEDSQIYELLSNPEYEGKIEKLPGTTSQGKEGQYYIIELNNDGGRYYHDLYTGITRSSQGSLIITNEPKLRSIQDSETHSEQLSGQAISAYSAERLRTLSALSESGANILYIEPMRHKKSDSSASASSKKSYVVPTSKSLVMEDDTTPATKAGLINAIANATTKEECNRLFDLADDIENNLSKDPDVLSVYNNKMDSFNPVSSDPTPDEIRLNIIDKLRAKGIEIGSDVTLDDTDDIYTILDVKVNDDDSISVIFEDEDGNQKLVSSTDMFTAVNPEPYTPPTEITSVLIPNGKTIKVGDYVLFEVEPELGMKEGHMYGKVEAIFDDGSLRTRYSNDEDDYDYDDIENIVDSATNLDEAERIANDSIQWYKDTYGTTDPGEKDPEEDPDDVVTEELKIETVEIINHTLNKPVEEVSKENMINKVQCYLYSYNTFESGVMTDSEGYPVQIGSDVHRHDLRLDSINGLMNLDKKLGRDIRKVKSYNTIIGKLRMALMNIKDKAELDAEINKIFLSYFGIDGISTKFGFISHAEQTKNGLPTDDGFSTSRGDFQRLQRHTSEDVQFINSNGERAKQTMRKTISCEFALDGEDVLELPLLSLSNPITLIANGVIDSQILSISGLSEINLAEDLDKIIEHAKDIHTAFNGAYDGFVKLVKVYREITDDAYYGIGDSTWTPAKAFRNRGIQAVGNERGDNYVEPGFEYEADYIDISKLAENPNLHISELLYSRTSQIDDGNGGFINIDGTTDLLKPGSPYVLITTDPRLKTTTDMVAAFQEDLRNGSDPRVKCISVLPPKCDIPTYLLNLAKLNVGKKDDIDDVGNINTAYNLVKALFANDNFMLNMSINHSSAWINSINSLLTELEGKEGDELKNALMKITSVGGVGITDKPIHAIFKRFLAEIAYPQAFSRIAPGFNGRGLQKGELGQVNQPMVDLITSCLYEQGIEQVWFRAKRKDNGVVYGPFNLLDANKDWTLTSIDGSKHSYQIHGKVDTNQFEGDLTSLLNMILKAHALDEKFGKRGPDKMDYIHRHAVSGSKNPGKDKLATTLNYVKTKTGLDIDPNTVGQNQISDIAYKINSNTKYTAFNINGKLVIFSPNDSTSVDFSNGKKFYDTVGNTSEIAELEILNDGRAAFNVTTEDGKTYQCVYDNNTKLIEIFYQDEPKSSSFVFDAVSFKQAQDLIKATPNPIFKMLFKNVIAATNSVEFTTALLSLPPGKLALYELAIQQMMSGNPDMAKNVIDTIKNEQQTTSNCSMKSVILKMI